MAWRPTLTRHSALTRAIIVAGVVAAVGWPALLLQLSVAVMREDVLGRRDEASDRHTIRTARPLEADPPPDVILADADGTDPYAEALPLGEPFALLHGILFLRDPAPSALEATLRGIWDATDQPEAPLLQQSVPGRLESPGGELSDVVDVIGDAVDRNAPDAL